MRRSRRPILDRALRRCLSIATFGRFIAAYAALDLVVVLIEVVASAFAPDAIPGWSFPTVATGSGPPAPDIKYILLNVSSYLVTAQVGALGVISLALALIAQRENSSTDVRIYYHEALAFELVASCVALLATLCVQLVWPVQFLVHLTGLGTPSQAFKLALLGAHMTWLLINLYGLAHFVVTTFGFVQQSRREVLRKRYTANFVQPSTMTKRLRQQIYWSAGDRMTEALGRGRNASFAFGFDYGHPRSAELEMATARPVALRDVCLGWVLLVVRRWHDRRGVTGPASPLSISGTSDTPPALWFTPHLDVPLRAPAPWCFRRGGVPLTRMERWLLRHEFRFEVIRDED